METLAISITDRLKWINQYLKAYTQQLIYEANKYHNIDKFEDSINNIVMFINTSYDYFVKQHTNERYTQEHVLLDGHFTIEGYDYYHYMILDIEPSNTLTQYSCKNFNNRPTGLSTKYISKSPYIMIITAAFPINSANEHDLRMFIRFVDRGALFEELSAQERLQFRLKINTPYCDNFITNFDGYTPSQETITRTSEFLINAILDYDNIVNKQQTLMV
jgi:hypothetical protein